jgi:hypothetical protein
MLLESFKPGQALFLASLLKGDLAGQKFEGVSRVIAIGGEATFVLEADLLDRQIADQDI